MTAVVPVDFGRAAELYRVARTARLYELTPLPEPATVLDLLALLVSVGLLSGEQATEVQKYVVAGGGYALPPVPWADGRDAGLYQLLRVKTLVPSDAFDELDGAAGVTAALALTVLPWLVDRITAAADETGAWVSGLFG